MFGSEFFALLFARDQFFSRHDGAIVHEDGSADRAFVFGMGVSGQRAGPGDVAVARLVVAVAAFGKDPASAVVDFAQSEAVGSDVRIAAGEPFFGDGKLVHYGEAKVVFF